MEEKIVAATTLTDKKKIFFSPIISIGHNELRITGMKIETWSERKPHGWLLD